MSQQEIYGHRCGAYSAWHRERSISRYVSEGAAHLLTMVDVDAYLWMEQDAKTREVLALIETARDTGNNTIKPTTAIRSLSQATSGKVSAYLVFYTLAKVGNPADLRQPDIEQFRSMRVWPDPTGFFVLTPKQWAEWILLIRLGKQPERLV
jgi:hypothetical protein